MFAAQLIVLLLAVRWAEAAKPENETAATWFKVAQDELLRAQQVKRLDYRAKNVILFLGDGMGISTVTAARILNGGEESLLSFEEFPHVGLSKTYCADIQVTDSASSATAYLCGAKANKGTVGVDERVLRGDCAASLKPELQLTSILDWSLAAGKSVGLVTTTRVTHASPSATYANVPDREWEGDVNLPQEAATAGCRDIARQLVEDYPDVQVIMGGGRKFFTADERLDKRDLTAEWEATQQSKGRRAKYVTDAQQLRQLNYSCTDYLFGLFADSHVDYSVLRNDSEQPGLAEMAKTAITILSRNPKGYFLFVEGGRIDHAHHVNMANLALHEAVDFSKAVKEAVALTSETDTLTVATADHSHTMVIAGYQSRGSSIFNVVDAATDHDGKAYTTLLYGSGPGYRYSQGRPYVDNKESNSQMYVQESVVPMLSAPHGGEDVGIYARGPMAHLFHAVHEENYIAHVMGYASCVGSYSNDCPPKAAASS